jgi:hypothetical protein
MLHCKRSKFAALAAVCLVGVVGLAVWPAMAQTYYAERDVTLNVTGEVEYFSTIPYDPYDYFEPVSGAIRITDFGWTDGALAYFTLDFGFITGLFNNFNNYFPELFASGSGATGSVFGYDLLGITGGDRFISLAWPGGGTQNQTAFYDFLPYPDASYGYNAEFTTTSYRETETLFNADGGVFRTFSFPVVVPEPSIWAMMLLGFAGLSFAGYRRARASLRRLAR